MGLRKKIIESLEYNDIEHPPTEKQLKNRETWHGKLCVYHLITSAVLTLAAEGVLAYGVLKLSKYIFGVE